MYRSAPGLSGHQPRHRPPQERSRLPASRRAGARRADRGDGFPWAVALMAVALVGLLWFALANVPQFERRTGTGTEKGARAPLLFHDGQR